MKLLLRIIGVVVLLALFIAIYTVLTSWSTRRAVDEGFTGSTQEIGQTGGFHLLRDITWEELDKVYRVKIVTQMNRSSILEEIATPSVRAAQNPVNDPVKALRITIYDTARQDDAGENIFNGQSVVEVNRGPIQSIEVSKQETASDQSPVIYISLTRGVLYRLQADPNNAGIVWVDILK